MNKVPFPGKRTRLLLHGPAISSSRERLQELKKKFDPDNIVVFDSEAHSGQVIASLMTVPMFSEERLIIWENPPEDFTSHTPYPISYTLILWFDHEIDIKKWLGFKIEFFSEVKEVSVFTFLDLLAFGDKRAFLEMEKLKKAGLSGGRQGFDIFYFLTMVYYLLRSLAVTPKAAKPFLRDKLQRQRKNFSPEKITSLYKDMLEIEFKLKSGLLEKPQAEFLLVNKFLN